VIVRPDFNFSSALEQLWLLHHLPNTERWHVPASFRRWDTEYSLSEEEGGRAVIVVVHRSQAEHICVDIFNHRVTFLVFEKQVELGVKDDETVRHPLQDFALVVLLLAVCLLLQKEFDALLVNKIAGELNAGCIEHQIVPGPVHAEAPELQADVDAVQPQQQSAAERNDVVRRKERTDNDVHNVQKIADRR